MTFVRPLFADLQNHGLQEDRVGGACTFLSVLVVSSLSSSDG